MDSAKRVLESPPELRAVVRRRGRKSLLTVSRERLGLSVAAAARKARMSVSTVRRLEAAGDAKLSTYRRYVVALDYFDYEVTDVLRGMLQPSPNRATA